jgi:hypothetical protein
MVFESLECDCFKNLRDGIQIHACCALFDLALASTDTYLSDQEEIRPRDNTPKRSPSMANVLSTGAWLSAPTKKPSFFARLLRSQIEARQRHADRLVEQYLVVHGGKMTDDAERQIERLIFKGGR